MTEIPNSAAKRARQRKEAEQQVHTSMDPDLSSLAVRQPKGQQSVPQGVDGFDERAKANTESVAKIHEFRRQNIKDYDAPNENLFEYQTEENDVKYSALKVENLFRFQNTMKAVRWGVFVGGLFGMHRYYRSRNFENAMAWFATISGISMFNIWVSYGIQEYVTQHGTTKGLQNAAREEYHNNAYKTYLERTQQQVNLLHDGANPILKASQSESMNDFIQELERDLQSTYKSEELIKEEVFDLLKGNLPLDQLRKRKLTKYQYQMVMKDVHVIKVKDQLERLTSQLYKSKSKNARKTSSSDDQTFKEMVVKDQQQLMEAIDEIVMNRIANIDLKSYDFESDPDCSYSFTTQKL